MLQAVCAAGSCDRYCLLSAFWYFSSREAIIWGLLKMPSLHELEKAVLLIGTLVCRRQSGAVDISRGFPAKL